MQMSKSKSGIKPIVWKKIEWQSINGITISQEVERVFSLAMVPEDCSFPLHGMNIGVVIPDESGAFVEILAATTGNEHTMGTLISDDYKMPVLIQSANGSFAPTCSTACMFCWICPNIVAGDDRPEV